MLLPGLLGLTTSYWWIRLLHIYSGFYSRVYILRTMKTGKKLPKRTITTVKMAPKTVDLYSYSWEGHYSVIKWPLNTLRANMVPKAARMREAAAMMRYWLNI